MLCREARSNLGLQIHKDNQPSMSNTWGLKDKLLMNRTLTAISMGSQSLKEW